VIASTLDARGCEKGDAVHDSVPGDLEGRRIQRILHLGDNFAATSIERLHSGLTRADAFID
jgi:hypothetical protein